jgi:chitin disaccharide deacetylase
MARLVLNADDFGASADTVQATIACFDRAALTSATIMPRAPATAEAIAFARERPDLSFGVHLTLVRDEDTRCVSEPGPLGRLVDEGGRFLPTSTFRARALLRRLPSSALELEIAAQIAYVQGEGVAVSHVDSHRHVHKLPVVQEALARVLPRFGIRRVRNVQDIYLRRPALSPTYWVGARWGRMLTGRFTTTAHFYMPTSAGDTDWHVPLLAVAGRLGSESLEVGVHPGDDEEWRRSERDSAVAFAAAAREVGHAFASWTDV